MVQFRQECRVRFAPDTSSIGEHPYCPAFVHLRAFRQSSKSCSARRGVCCWTNLGSALCRNDTTMSVTDRTFKVKCGRCFVIHSATYTMPPDPEIILESLLSTLCGFLSYIFNVEDFKRFCNIRGKKFPHPLKRRSLPSIQFAYLGVVKQSLPDNNCALC